MMKKMWKNRSGVSPVIATILMVAITVVLAAVLYVMVMGFGSPSTQTPTGSLSSAKSGNNYTVSVVSISKSDVLKTDVKFVLTPAATGALGNYTSADSRATHVSAADYVIVDGSKLTKGTTYTISLIYNPTGNAIASTTITVPA